MEMRSLTKSNGIIGTVVLGVALSGCNLTGIDNYDAPNAMLSGTVHFNGAPINLRSGGVELELWEPAFELRTKIPIYVDQTGAFSAMVFNGDYRLNTINNNGPWLNRTDTLSVQVRGNTQVDVPVQPYYVVQNPQVTYDAGAGAGGSVTASFQVGTVNASRQVEWVGLYVGTTAFVDRINRLVQLERTQAQLPADWATNPVSLTVALPANIRVTPSPEPRTHVFVRVGIKSAGLAEMIFSPLIKLAI